MNLDDIFQIIAQIVAQNTAPPEPPKPDLKMIDWLPSVPHGRRIPDERDFSKRRIPAQYVVVHTTGAGIVQKAFDKGIKDTRGVARYACDYYARSGNNVSTHFLIDWDGTIYQLLDPLQRALHAGEVNNISVGIDLNNLMKNMARDGYHDAPPYRAEHPYWADPRPEWTRASPVEGRIHGSPVKAWGYTEAQYVSLGALARALRAQLPGVSQAIPDSAESGDLCARLDDPAKFSGFVGHCHTTIDRWDPGPAFDWARLGAELGRTP